MPNRRKPIHFRPKNARLRPGRDGLVNFDGSFGVFSTLIARDLIDDPNGTVVVGKR